MGKKKTLYLILKFVERLSNAEIGEIMDRTEGAIKSLYHRTLLSLRGIWDGEEEAAVDAPLREFFGSPFQPVDYRSLPMAMDAGRRGLRAPPLAECPWLFGELAKQAG